MSVITLTTDFGMQDSYVGEMKGIILSNFPSAQIADICHAIPPYNITLAAFQLLRSYKYFPAGTVHVVVVDPGVGGKRKALYVKTQQYHFVGPDNGVLKWAIENAESVDGKRGEYFEIPIPELPSHTCHGRDVFLPFAVRVLQNQTPFLKKMSTLIGKDFPGSRELNGVCRGEVICSDVFGNVITSVSAAVNSGSAQVGDRPEKYDFARCYDDIREDQIALIRGSHGYWEFAARRASAWNALRVKVGDPVTVYP